GQNQPDVSLRVGANSGIVEAATTLPDTTVRGRIDATSLLQSICDRIGWIFENASDVHVILSNPSYSGSAWKQAKEIARHMNVAWALDDTTFAIWPRGSPRSIPPVAVSPDSGLVGYPSFDGGLALITVLFNPDIRQGVKLAVSGSELVGRSGERLSGANGDFIVAAVTHQLDAQVSGGRWFSQVQAYRYDGPGAERVVIGNP